MPEDELHWNGSSHYFDLAVCRGHLDHPDWRLRPARENPPVAKSLLGAALAASGEADEQAKREAVAGRIGAESLRALQATGRVELPLAWLRPARAGRLVGVAAASLRLFLLGRALLGSPPELGAALALPVHPMAAKALTDASADAPARPR